MNPNHAVYLATLIVGLAFCISSSATKNETESKMPFPTGRAFLFRLTLADKCHNRYTLDKPREFLSMRSINRRLRQNLALDSTDLPVSPQYLRVIGAQGVQI